MLFRSSTLSGATEPRSRHLPDKLAPLNLLSQSGYTDICRALYEALPSSNDIKHLIGTGRATIFLQALCNPYGELFGKSGPKQPTALFTIPFANSHPVLLARKLLQLSLCIQQLDTSFDRSCLSLGFCPEDARDKYFNLASSTVTCHDELLDSLEGLECLLYEGVYLVNSGNLRRSLLCLRRASTLAQFMDMHHKTPSRRIKQHDPLTRVSGHFTWEHIAYLERYISLLLGLSSSITGPKFLLMKSLPIKPIRNGWRRLRLTFVTTLSAETSGETSALSLLGPSTLL